MSSSPSRPTPDLLTQITTEMIERQYLTLEHDLETLVSRGQCICFEIVNGVLQYSNWFVHPYCPQHGPGTPNG